MTITKEHIYLNEKEHKHCFKCDTWKPLIYFSKSKDRKDGLSAYCKECNKQTYTNRPEKYKLREKEYRKEN